MGKVLMTTILSAVAGFCTRPCCAIPAAMSLFGLSVVAFAQTAVAYRPALMSVSGLMLAATLWITLRRDGGSFNKAIAVTAALAGFVLSLQVLEVM
jgi:hypothetical protein